jgi:hypothetical protein
MGMINRGQLSTRAQMQLAKYRMTGDPVLIEESVRLFQEALDATPDSHPNRSMYLANLSATLIMLHGETQDTANLVDAASMLQEAVAVTPRGHRYWAGYMANRATALSSLSDQTGDLDMLEDAVQAYRDALAATSRLSPRRAGRLSGLGTSLWSLFDQTGDSRTLMEAIKAIRDSIAATRSPASRASRLAVLGRILDDRFDETGELHVLAESVKAHRESVAIIPVDHLQRSQLVVGAIEGCQGIGRRIANRLLAARSPTPPMPAPPAALTTSCLPRGAFAAIAGFVYGPDPARRYSARCSAGRRAMITGACGSGRLTGADWRPAGQPGCTGCTGRRCEIRTSMRRWQSGCRSPGGPGACRPGLRWRIRGRR